MTILCADDFGMTAGISEGIIALARHKKIQAASVMVEAPLMTQYGRALADTGIQIGLHFNLTHPFNGKAAASLRALVLQLRLKKDVEMAFRLHLRRQLQAFERFFGMAPAFVDGHQHVHILPCIRHLFLEEMARKYPAGTKRPWIRQLDGVWQKNGAIKAAILAALNFGFRRRCAALGFATNQRFGGVYSFDPAADYQAYLQGWRAAGDDLLIMCHPSLRPEAEDPISAARVNEFKALMG